MSYIIKFVAYIYIYIVWFFFFNVNLSQVLNFLPVVIDVFDDQSTCLLKTVIKLFKSDTEAFRNKFFY